MRNWDERTWRKINHEPDPWCFYWALSTVFDTISLRASRDIAGEETCPESKNLPNSTDDPNEIEILVDPESTVV